MIGLKDGMVIVSEYDDSWVSLFEKEKELILKQLTEGAVSVEHIGSTSVPGLCAKPIIDILIGIEHWSDAQRYVQAMERCGYVFMGEYGIPFRNFFVKGNPRTHHVHMVEKNGTFRLDHLWFRNYLRCHAEEKENYAELKRRLAEKYPEDRDRYLQSKADFIQGIVRNRNDDAAKPKSRNNTFGKDADKNMR